MSLALANNVASVMMVMMASLSREALQQKIVLIRLWMDVEEMLLDECLCVLVGGGLEMDTWLMRD